MALKRGQERSMKLSDLRRPIFYHGHLDMGLRSVREAINIAIFNTMHDL